MTEHTRRARERARERFTGRKVSSLSPEECEAAHAAGYEPHGSGHDYLAGRDPRKMTQDELRAIGHEPMSATAALRMKCLDCMAGSPDEVRCCVAMSCSSWPWRMGTNQWRAPPSEARRESGRRLAAIRSQKAPVA